MNKTKRIILIDMDETIADYSSKTFKYLNNHLCHIKNKKDTWKYINKNLIKEHELICQSKGFFKDLLPIPGSIDAIKTMKQSGYIIRFCSTPQIKSTSHSDKCDWILNVFGEEMAKDLILTHDKTLIKGDILIDDKVNIKGIRKPDWQHILFRSPYNIDSNPQYVLESWFHDWNKIFQDIFNN